MVYINKYIPDKAVYIELEDFFIGTYLKNLLQSYLQGTASISVCVFRSKIYTLLASIYCPFGNTE